MPDLSRAERLIEGHDETLLAPELQVEPGTRNLVGHSDKTIWGSGEHDFAVGGEISEGGGETGEVGLVVVRKPVDPDEGVLVVVGVDYGEGGRSLYVLSLHRCSIK
jgi:hypothetical protein